MAAGAVGQCCAKLGEAEVLADAGIGGLLLTSPVQHPAKIDRLMALLRRSPDLAVVVEDEANVRQLGQAAAAAGLRLAVLIDCDVGTHRFGVISPAAAVEVAQAIAAQPALELRGVQGYAGPLPGRPPTMPSGGPCRTPPWRCWGRARDALRDGRLRLPDRDRQRHRHARFRSRAGRADRAAGRLLRLLRRDLRRRDAWRRTARHRFRNSLFVHTRIVSDQHPGFATSDAGSKSFAMDGPAPVIMRRRARGLALRPLRRRVRQGRAARSRRPGCRSAACSAASCRTAIPNVNLFDHYHCVRGDRLVELWPIEARGCAG